MIAFSAVLLLALCRIFLPGFFLAATMPFVRTGDAVSASFARTLSGFGNTEALAAAKQELIRQNDALAVENRTLADQVSSLSALLGASGSPAASPAIIAAVLARPPVSPYDSLIIAGGARDGIADGMEAFGNGGVPIGFVSSVAGSFARITLYTAPRESLAVWVGGSHTPLTITGVGGGAFTASAPRSAGFTDGETVYAPGPGAIPIGVIGSLTGAAASPTVTVHIVPVANPFSLAYVALRDVGSALTGALSCASSTAL